MRLIVVPPNLKHVKNMTSRIGFFQFAKGEKPDKKYGYSIDDQARSLILTTKIYLDKKDPEALGLSKIYLDFIEKAQLKNGFFHNFTDDKGQFTDKVGSMDSFGRTIWALGFAIAADVPSLSVVADKIWNKAQKNIKSFKYLRTNAFCLSGLYWFWKKNKDKKSQKLISEIANNVANKFEKDFNSSWQWFEDRLTYANAIVPYSLLFAFEITKEEKLLKVGLESLDFLNRICRLNGKPAPIGNRGWYEKGKKINFFDQQTIDAADMVLANLKAYEVSKKGKYKKMAIFWYSWFTGNNVIGQIMYNKKGGCYDGILKNGVKKNMGAESTILFQLINYEMLKM